MRVIDDATVSAALPPSVVRGLMRDLFLATAAGRTDNPVRSVAALPAGWFAAMPAYVDANGLRGLGAKLVAVFPGNGARGLPTHRATIAMYDPADGALIALVGADAITERRTAAASVIATQRLALRPEGRYGILGSGVQGRAHIEAFHDAGLIRELSIWSRTAANAAALAEHARSIGIDDVRVGATPAESARDADVIVTATGAQEPILFAADVSAGVHVNAVGACIPRFRELDAGVIAQAAVYADSRDAALRESGDILLAMRDLGWSDAITAELGEMMADPGRPARSDRRITVFESLGLGSEDIICAAYVLQHV